MSKSLTKAPANQIEYTAEQIQLIKNTVAVGATDNELGLFLQVCKNRKLDPFTRQIHFVKRTVKNKDGTYRQVGTIQTGIDGFRAIAERTGEYAGNDDPVFDNEQLPKKATVTVWKIVGGVRCPFSATARWDQYYPGDLQGFMWKKMPHVMLGKCAEALALRKAFPEALSGLYSDDEMEQSGKPDTVKAEVVDAPKQSDFVNPDGSHVVPEPKTPKQNEVEAATLIETKSEAPEEDLSKPATAEQVREIASLCKDLGGTVPALYEKFGIKGQPTRKQAIDLIQPMRKKLGIVTEAEVAQAEEAAKAA